MTQNLRGLSSTLLNVCHRGLEQFLMLKVIIQPGTTKDVECIYVI